MRLVVAGLTETLELSYQIMQRQATDYQNVDTATTTTKLTRR